MIDPAFAIGLYAVALALIFIGYQFKEGLTTGSGAALLLVVGLLVISEGVGVEINETINTTVNTVTKDPTGNETQTTSETHNATSTTRSTVPSNVTVPIGLVGFLLGLGIILANTMDVWASTFRRRRE